MKSQADTPLLEDLSFTAADIEAMRRAADAATRISSEEYLAFLTRSSAHIPPSRRTSEGWEPFRLD